MTKVIKAPVWQRMLLAVVVGVGLVAVTGSFSPLVVQEGEGVTQQSGWPLAYRETRTETVPYVDPACVGQPMCELGIKRISSSSLQIVPAVADLASFAAVIFGITRAIDLKRKKI